MSDGTGDVSGLRFAEARYRSVVQSALDAIITINVENRVTEFNPAAESIFGHKREDVLGRELADLIIPEEMRSAHREGLKRHQNSPTAPRLGRRIELEALRADGSRFPIELTVTREGGCGDAQFTAFIRDLSQQRLAEARATRLAENLRNSQRLLTGLLSNLPGMAFQCGLEDMHSLSFVSDGSEQLCGYSAREFLSNHVQWNSLVHEGDRPALLQARRQAPHTGGRYEMTYRIRARDGAGKWVMERGTVTAEISSGSALIDGLVVDVTAGTVARQQVELLNAELESRVKARTAELESANSELETFSYSIAHDLRAPLTSIAGFTRLIEERTGQQDLAHYFTRVRSGIRHMDKLIDAMLSLAKIKRAAARSETTDLAAQAREVVERLAQKEPDRKIELDLPQSALVLGDPVLLAQVIENLVGNAWKFSGKSPTTHIRMTCMPAGQDGCVVSIEDRGVGFDPECASRLFKPFVRLHSGQEFDGTGVGLAIVHRIVTHHGGAVGASSQPGKGSCFWFTLPTGRRP